MNAADVLRYGHLTVVKTLDGLPEAEWETTGVCGIWSVKDIIAHLASYEHVLIDVLCTFLEPDRPTPHLTRWQTPEFNDAEVDARRAGTLSDVMSEYTNTHARTMELIVQVPAEARRTMGTLPWYGAEYTLDDFIVYTYYGHKREHSAQIAVFRNSLGLPPAG